MAIKFSEMSVTEFKTANVHTDDMFCSNVDWTIAFNQTKRYWIVRIKAHLH